MPEPPSVADEVAREVSQMDLDVPAPLAVPLRRVSPAQRLIQTHRGPRIHGNVLSTSIFSAANALRMGATSLPFHLETPLLKYGKFHQLTRRRGHAMEVFFVMYDKTGTRLFTGSDDWLIKIWSTHTGLLVNTLRGHKAAITYMCVDPTNRYLASASDDNTIRVWSLSTYTNVAVLQDVHTKSVAELSWSPAPFGNVLVSMALDGFIRAWEVLPINVTGDVDTLLGKDTTLRFRETSLDPINNSPCQSGPLSPCGTRALASCKDGSIRILALNPLRQLQRIVAHGANVPYTAWSTSANRFLTASDDGTSKIYEYLSPERGWVLKQTLSILEVQAPGAKPKMLGVKWSLHGDLIILSFQRTALHNWKNLKVFDPNTGKLMGCLDGHIGDVHAMAIHPTDPRILATAGYDQRIIIWNIYTMQPCVVLHLPNYEEEECPITELSWNPNGTQLVVSDIIGTFTIFGIGPTDSFKGPVEQFFGTDYHETTIDAEGYVIDNETLLPPHLTPRTPLCFRTGRVHDSPPILPPLRDPRTEIPPRELELSLAQRTVDAEAEDHKYVFGEPVVEVAAGAVGRGTRAQQAGGGAAGRRAPSPPPPALPRATRSHVHQPPVLANLPVAIGGSTGRLRRNNTSGEVPNANAMPGVAPRPRGRPPRRAAASIQSFAGLDDDLPLLSSDDEQTIQNIRNARHAMEDAIEIDFSGEDHSSDDSISSDGDGGKPRDALDDDLYWSGDSNTAHFKSPAERRAAREVRRLNPPNTVAGRTRGAASRGSGAPRRTASMMDEDSDEEYGARPKRRMSSTNSAAAPPPPRQHKRKTRESGTDDEDAFLDIMSNSSSDIPIIDSDDEDYKVQTNTTKKRDRSGRVKPPEYPAWVKQELPSTIFCPQLGDEVVFFRSGYMNYLSHFPKIGSNDVPDEIPEITYCTITDIRFDCDPFVHALVSLTPIIPQPPIPTIDTDPTHDTLCSPLVSTEPNGEASFEDGETGDEKKRPARKKKGLKVKINTGRAAAPTAANPTPYISIASQARQNLEASSSSSSSTTVASAVSVTNIPTNPFIVRYHGNAEVPDFIVLATRFNQGMSMPWYIGKRVSAWIASDGDPTQGDDYPGTVLDANTDTPWESVTIIWEDESSGTDGMKMSPWELEAVDGEGRNVPIFSEIIDPSASLVLAKSIENYMKNHSSVCEMFTNQVPLDKWPSYFNINPRPSFLKLVIARLRNQWYRSVQSLKYDIRAIHANSLNFNGHSEISEDANTLCQSILEMVDSMAPSIVMVPKSSNQGDTSHFDESTADERHRTEDEGAPRPKSNTPKKKRAKKRKRGTFGEVYESDTTDPEDLLPYRSAPLPPTKKPPTAIVDPVGFTPLHEENRTQRDADTAAEKALTYERNGSSIPSEAPPRATRIRVKSSTRAQLPSEEEESEPILAAPPARVPRVRQAKASVPNDPAPHNPPQESPSGRPIRTTRSQRVFKNEIEEDEDDDVFLDEEVASPPKRRRN
jgi:hypothetical protein